jgi:tetratricopeptide (TPR) repeat protein
VRTRSGAAALALALVACAHAAPERHGALGLAPAAFTEPAVPQTGRAAAGALPYAAILPQIDDAALRSRVAEQLQRLAADSASADLRDGLGRLLVDAKLPGLAVAPLQDALYLRPGRLSTAALLAGAYVDAGRGDEALALARRLTGERPYQDDRWLFRAEIERRLDQRAAARDSAERCLLINPDAAPARAVLGFLYADEGRAALAKQLLAEALSDPGADRAPLEHRLGSLALDGGDYQEALEHLDRALEARPDYGAAHNDRGVALARLGRRDEARAEFAAAAAAAPQLGEAHVNLANVLIDDGAREKAAEQMAAAGEGVDPAALFVAAGRLYALDVSSATGRARSLAYFERAGPLVDAPTRAAIERAVAKIRSLPPAAAKAVAPAAGAVPARREP